MGKNCGFFNKNIYFHLYFFCITPYILLFLFQDSSVIGPFTPILLTIVPAIYIAVNSEQNLYENNPILYNLTFGLIGSKITNKLIVSKFVYIYEILNLLNFSHFDGTYPPYIAGLTFPENVRKEKLRFHENLITKLETVLLLFSGGSNDKKWAWIFRSHIFGSLMSFCKSNRAVGHNIFRGSTSLGLLGKLLWLILLFTT